MLRTGYPDLSIYTRLQSYKPHIDLILNRWTDGLYPKFDDHAIARFGMIISGRCPSWFKVWMSFDPQDGVSKRIDETLS